MCLKIRCDGKSEKFCKIFWELNKAIYVHSFGSIARGQHFEVWLYKAGPCLLPPKKPKIFQDSPSHRIFKRIHGVLNIDENKD